MTVLMVSEVHGIVNLRFYFIIKRVKANEKALPWSKSSVLHEGFVRISYDNKKLLHGLNREGDYV